jgi:UDP-glucose 4-epimerase
MKILITGNAGMIGSVLANFFLERGWSVIGIDNLSGGFLRNVNPKIKFYPIDIYNLEEVENIFKIEKPDYVIHCAAYAAEILSPFIRNFNYKNNVLGSVNIINSCINHSVKKIINFSSFATYGDGKPPFKESDQRVPKDPYGIAKLTIEMDLKEAYEHFGLRYSTILPHNVISKYQNYFDKYRNVIAIWIRQCIKGENITIYGDGLQVRAFSDAQFICDPVEKLLYGHDSESFNIGSNNPVAIKDAAELVIKIAKNFGLNKSNLEFLEARREVKFAYCSHEKAEKELGFIDNSNLEKMINEMFEYALTLPNEEVKNMNYEIVKNIYSYWK